MLHAIFWAFRTQLFDAKCNTQFIDQNVLCHKESHVDLIYSIIELPENWIQYFCQ